MLTQTKYGNEMHVMQPLPFSVVNEDRPNTSAFALFRLPEELFPLITQCLDEHDLSSLALVDRACFQLVRAQRFHHIRLFLHNDRTTGEILSILLEESRIREENQGGCFRSSLGSCIRQITIGMIGMSLAKNGTLHLVDKTLYETYTSQLTEAMRVSLPNLISLRWLDECAFPTDLMNATARSGIRHLHIHHMLYTSGPILRLEIPKSERCWSLQSLELDFSPVLSGYFDQGHDFPISSLVQDLLLDNAHWLEKILWMNMPQRLPSFTQSSNLDLSAITQFPHLELLAVRLIGQPWEQDILSFMLSGPRLRILDVEAAKPSVCQLLSRRGEIPSLKSFVWHDYRAQLSVELDTPGETRPELCAIIAFCEANTQLETMAFPYPISNTLIENKLLPLFATFRSLSSLALVFGDKEIPESALNMIAQISSLEQLWLSAGNQSGWKHDWGINHVAIRIALAPLQRLEKIAFTRDSYNSGWREEATDRYYDQRLLPPGHSISDYIGRGEPSGRDGDPDDIDDNDGAADMGLAWEKYHLLRVMNHAKKYAQVFPRLDWIYVGQLPMAIAEETRKGRLHRKPVPINTQRNDYWTLLKRMWGMIL